MTTTTVTEAAGTVAPTRAGVMRVQIISEGVGSSGTYPGTTLEQAAEAGVFPAGLHVHFDHPTATESVERPERSVLTLAGTLTSDAEWNAESRALEADFTPYPSVRDAIVERADDIGLSIRASAEITEDGTISRIVEAQSVDLVTQAGRGGRILEVIESARREIAERNGLAYTPRHAATVTSTAPDPHSPEPDSSPAPAQESTASTSTAGGTMVEINESELSTLRESAGQVEQLRESLATEKARADQAEQALTEALTERTRAQAETIVAEAFEGIDAPKAKARLIEAATTGAETFDPDAFKAEAQEAAAEFTPAGPTVTGFGNTTAAPVSESHRGEDLHDQILETMKGIR
jgi:hypothetical protein